MSGATQNQHLKWLTVLMFIQTYFIQEKMIGYNMTPENALSMEICMQAWHCGICQGNNE